jgi:hypothetical protein
VRSMCSNSIGRLDGAERGDQRRGHRMAYPRHRICLQRRRDRPGQNSTISAVFQLLPIKERAVSAQKLEIRISLATAKSRRSVPAELPALRVVISDRRTPADLKNEIVNLCAA